jgi:uncharacterized protein YndB with AHSA1/START domain
MTTNNTHDLVLERVIDVPPTKVWDAWTTPETMTKWFTPDPWKTVSVEMELTPGGKFNSVMESPEGQQFPNSGCILEVVPGHKLVWTDALLPGFRPSANPFVTACIEIFPEGTGTRYRATALHKDEETMKKHEEMGFHEGWGAALDQLVAVIKGTRG